MLEWFLEWGPHEQMLIRRARKGKRTPALDRKPTLHPHLEFPWSVFALLHSQRGKATQMEVLKDGRTKITTIPKPVSISDLKAALDVYECYGDFAVTTMQLVAHMDVKYIAWEASRKSREK